jgi:hypothetical protein
MLIRCNCPVNGQSHFAVLGYLRQRLLHHGISQQPRIKLLIMQPTG